jgi:hypothetical protein
MSDKPIIFSGPMVRALLGGRKTQTRRVLNLNQMHPVMKTEPHTITVHGSNLICRWHSGLRYDVKSPYAPGDRLYVREAWRAAPPYDGLAPSEMVGDESIKYEADGHWESWGWGDTGCTEGGRYRHARFMPRWASRLTLTVTDVRVQRLQEISVDDAIAEGRPQGGEFLSARRWFHQLWNSLHGPEAWDANPWVVCLSFQTHRKNIDEMEVEDVSTD